MGRATEPTLPQGLVLGTVSLAAVFDGTGQPPSASGEQPVTLRLRQGTGAKVLSVELEQHAVLHTILLTPGSVWRAGDGLLMARAAAPAGGDNGSSSSAAGGPTLVLRGSTEEGRRALQEVEQHAACAGGRQDVQQPAAAPAGGGAGGQQGEAEAGGDSHFDSKTDKASADLYWRYYGCLQHQQNMLQDYIRTGTYYAAIVENPADFEGKAVMDVGCGSGILSLFAAQAGARVVYAVEASDMAHHARQLAAANPGIGDRIKVLHGKVEEVEVPEKVDVLVSEPMGTLLVNERMIESYLYARDRFLKPGGKMFPRLGRVHVCAFSDEALYGEVAQKASFFQNPSFYGVDLTPLHAPATAGYFGQVVVDQIPPNVLVSNCITQTFDFLTATEAELHDITVPLSLQVAVPCTVHGVASWFDVLFDGSQTQRWLSTAPGLPITHWFQLRCLMQHPVVVAQPGATVRGELRLVAHNRQSYDVHVTLRAPPLSPGEPEQVSTGTFDLKEPYYRQQMQWMMQMAQAATAPAADAGGTVAVAAELPAAPAAEELPAAVAGIVPGVATPSATGLAAPQQQQQQMDVN